MWLGLAARKTISIASGEQRLAPLHVACLRSVPSFCCSLAVAEAVTSRQPQVNLIGCEAEVLMRRTAS